ncbi:hypothetical protein L1887_61338 [Cichorium endivia]|nr:hypothetical protein L1887_61338 [Cichorium endivia]
MDAGAAARQRENAGSAANSEMHARSKSSHGKMEQHSTAQHSTVHCNAAQHGAWGCGCVDVSPPRTNLLPTPSSPGHLFAISPFAFTIGTRSFPVHSGFDNARVQPSHISSRPPRPLLHRTHRPSLSGPFASLRIRPVPSPSIFPPAADSWRGLFVRGLRR